MKKIIIAFVLILIYNPVFSQKVEKLLTQGKLEKANAYCEKQGEGSRSECFMKIAHHYLSKGDYTNAEIYFKKSGEIDKGYILIANAYMKGEIVDSVLIFDAAKVKDYLEKVYTDENKIHGEMAKGFEKHANESKKRTEFIKSLDKMGIIAMSQGGKTIQIKQALLLSKIKTEFYFFEAANQYEKMGDIEKAEELKKELDILKMPLN